MRRGLHLRRRRQLAKWLPIGYVDNLCKVLREQQAWLREQFVKAFGVDRSMLDDARKGRR